MPLQLDRYDFFIFVSVSQFIIMIIISITSCSADLVFSISAFSSLDQAGSGPSPHLLLNVLMLSV